MTPSTWRPRRNASPLIDRGDLRPMRNPLRVGFVRDVALTGGAQFAQAFLALLAGVLVARYLGPSGRGTLSVLLALGSMAVLLGSFGLHFSAVYFLGRFKAEREGVVSNVVLAGITGGLVAGVTLAAAGTVFHRQLLHDIRPEIFFLYVLSVPLMYFNSFGRAIILGLARVRVYNVPVLIEGSGLLLGTAGALALFGSRLEPLVILRVVIELAIFALVFLYIIRSVRLRLRLSRELLRRQLGYGLKNYASSLGWLFLIQSDLILCNYFLGNGPTGVYSVAVSLGLPITMIASVVGTLTFQRVSADDDRTRRIANTNRTVRILVPTVTTLAVAVGVSAVWVVPFVFGAQFNAAANALILLLPGLVAISLELVMMNFLGGEGSPPIVYWAPIAGLVLNLGANLFVIPRWGIDGAAVTSSVAYGAVFALLLAYYLRWTGSRLREVLVLRGDDVRSLGAAGGPRTTRPPIPRESPL